MRALAVIAYDGSGFEGFQRQSHTTNTIENRVLEALRGVGIDSTITASGRTDSGVHATGQVIAFDLPAHWKNLDRLRYELNRKLDAIYIRKLLFVSKDFHPRFDAKKRAYYYLYSSAKPSLFHRNLIAHLPKTNNKRLAEALELFVGRHDFEALHKRGSNPSSTIRTIYKASLRSFDRYEVIILESNGFLRSQVRLMVALAHAYSQERITKEEFKQQLLEKRKIITSPAPWQGLYLGKIYY